MAVAPALALPSGDLRRLRERVTALSEQRPAVYRMLDPAGRVIYVGKARKLRTRLLSYFRAAYPEDKQARILHAAGDIRWDYKPSEFAALLGEMRAIKRFRPPFNVRMNGAGRVAFIKLFEGRAPKLAVAAKPSAGNVRHYGPLTGVSRVKECIRILSDLTGLRDCALDTAIAYAEQRDLFTPGRRAGCLRHELRTCSGPCAGFVTEREYRKQAEIAAAFLEGRSIVPLDRVIAEMQRASERQDYERAAWWRDRFDALTWLMESLARTQAAIDTLSFVYTDPGVYGDDRAYVIKRARVRASAPAPLTPIEREAFRALVAKHATSDSGPTTVVAETIDETLLLLRWFRRNPNALRRTVSLESWLSRDRAEALN